MAVVLGGGGSGGSRPGGSRPGGGGPGGGCPRTIYIYINFNKHMSMYV